MKLNIDYIDGVGVTVAAHRAGLSTVKLLRHLADLAGGSWSAEGGRWVFPASFVLELVERVGHGELTISDRVHELVRGHRRDNPKPVPTVESIDYEFKTKPFQHQVEAFLAARHASAHALLMEMGTGKTKVAIDTTSHQIASNVVDRVLVLCPKALLFSWERELDVHSPLPPERRRVVVVTGSAARKAKAIGAARTASVLITNYQTLLTHLDELADWVEGGRTAMVADEVTAIKNPHGKMFKAACKLGERAVVRYALTGTPVTQSPLDLYALFKFLDPKILGHQTFTSFKAEYAVTVRLQGVPVPVIKSYRNLDRLAALIKPYSTRVLKAECLDLPEKMYKTVELPMGPKQAELYRQMRDEAVVDVGHQQLAAPVVLTKLLRLQQISSGFLPIINEYGVEVGQTSIEDAPKLDACRELVEEALESKQKVIVWCRFTWEVEQLAATLGKIANVVVYHGATSAEQRQANVDAMQTGDAQVFIGQIQTGGMGITLTAASVVIYYSNTFSLSDRLQSEDRAHRIGQVRNVLYVDLVCTIKGGVDSLVLKSHREKKNLADMVTGDNLRLFLGEE